MKTMLKFMILICLLILYGCAQNSTSVALNCSKDVAALPITEIPPWVLSQARVTDDGKIEAIIQPKGFRITPKRAAFIYGTLLHVDGKYDMYPNVRMFVSTNAYFLLPSGDQTKGSPEQLLASPNGVFIRGEDGAVFNKMTQRWCRMGYVNEQTSRFVNSVKGKKAEEVLTLMGLPFETGGTVGNDSATSQSWNLELTPHGYSYKSTVFETDFLVKKTNDSSYAIWLFWCKEDLLTLQFEYGKVKKHFISNGFMGKK